MVCRWYWFIAPEVLKAVLLGVYFGFVLLFPYRYLLWVMVFVCLAIARNVMEKYRQRVYERIGPDRIPPPQMFRVFWKTVMVLQIIGMIGMIGWLSWRVFTT